MISATIPSGRCPARATPDSPVFSVATALCGLLVLAVTDWPRVIFADRLDALAQYEGLAIGADLTLILAHAFSEIMPSELALAIASGLAVPALAAMIHVTARGQKDAAITAAGAGHTIVFGLALSGLGWAAPGLYGLWRLLLSVRDSAPRRGMPLAGMGAVGAFLTIPQFAHYLFPFGAVLFLWAPRTMLVRHMRVFYILTFTPVAMAAGSFAYCAWIGGRTLSMPRLDLPLGMPGDANGLLLLLLLTVASAPLLFKASGIPAGLQRLGVLFVLFATAGADPVNMPVLLAGAVLAQSALMARYGAGGGVALTSVILGAAAVAALDWIAGIG